MFLRPLLLTVVLLCQLIPAGVRAADIEAFFMPGKVARAHAKFEKDCNQCHGKQDRHARPRKCLACHDHADVDRDIRGHKGYHGRLQARGVPDCNQCHREHEGRGASLVILNPGTFDHRRTDFQLKGQHRSVNCRACHKPDRKYREAPSACVACHKKQDVHQGKLGKRCDNCHVPAGWRKSGFDHDRKTDFPLRGKHGEVACVLCHPANRYKKTPRRCVACHAVNDAHGGRYGQKCQTCHAERGWKRIHFDHDRKTDFPLRGRHAKVVCDACHTGRLYEQKLETRCVACHRHDDVHKGRNGTKCESCHSPKSWRKSSFDHDRKTDFPLRGKHRKLVCEACHRGGAGEKLKTACIACHKERDVHGGQMGKACERCHNANSWQEKVFFEHDITRFPLIGMHAVAACEACHLTTRYQDAPMKCVACHQDKDVHEGRFGPACDACHNPNSWANWLFDHARQADFPLDGAHGELRCKACHRTERRAGERRSKACIRCHQADDVHHGGFGRRCDQCHNTRDFRQAKVNNTPVRR